MTDKLKQGEVETWASETVGWWRISQLDNDLDIGTSEGKASRRKALSRLAQAGKLEKHPHEEGKYRFVRTEISKLDPKANPNAVLSLNWPKDIETEEHFALENIKVYPKSVIVCAGVSNQCKTAFLLNFLVENMENHHCVYITNELGDEEFVDRLSAFDWVECTNGTGEWKFDAIEHFDNHQDIIQSDAINIIDYLDPGENPYFIGVLIDQIRKKLNKGIAVVAVQKGITTWQDKDGKKHFSYREYGTGGQYSEHRARLVLHFDPTGEAMRRYLLTIKKSKVANMTGRKFKFDLRGGSRLTDIEEVME